MDGRFAEIGKAVSANDACLAKQAALARRTSHPPAGQGVPLPLDPLFAVYLSHLERKGRDPKTISRNRCSLNRLNSWLSDGGYTPDGVAEIVLEEYVAWLSSTFAENTANREVVHIKSAYRYALRLGTISGSPAANLE